MPPTAKRLEPFNCRRNMTKCMPNLTSRGGYSTSSCMDIYRHSASYSTPFVEFEVIRVYCNGL